MCKSQVSMSTQIALLSRCVRVKSLCLLRSLFSLDVLESSLYVYSDRSSLSMCKSQVSMSTQIALLSRCVRVKSLCLLRSRPCTAADAMSARRSWTATSTPAAGLTGPIGTALWKGTARAGTSGRWWPTCQVSAATPGPAGWTVGDGTVVYNFVYCCGLGYGVRW